MSWLHATAVRRCRSPFASLEALLQFRLEAGVAVPVEHALADARGSERSAWATAGDVGCSGLGWVAVPSFRGTAASGDPSVLHTHPVSGYPLPGQRFRLLHRAVPLPHHRAHPGMFPSSSRTGGGRQDPDWERFDGGLECYRPFLDLLDQQPRSTSPKLLFLDIDNVVAPNMRWSHEAAPLEYRASAATDDLRTTTSPCRAPELASFWAAETNEMAKEPRCTASTPRFPVTLYTWRRRLTHLHDGIGSEVVDRLHHMIASLRQQGETVGIVIISTHVAFADAAAFRSVLLWPLPIVGVVWPRSIVGVLDWIHAFVQPRCDEVSMAIVDDRCEFYRWGTVQQRGRVPATAGTSPSPPPQDGCMADRPFPVAQALAGENVSASTTLAALHVDTLPSRLVHVGRRLPRHASPLLRRSCLALRPMEKPLLQDTHIDAIVKRLAQPLSLSRPEALLMGLFLR